MLRLVRHCTACNAGTESSARGTSGLQRAEELSRALGLYTLQAGIVACHARTGSLEQTDWPRIVALYDALGAWVSNS
jgi:predicted RNA polymerase sigma factor